MTDKITFGGLPVPWNASWSGEDRYEVRPCRWAEGLPAMWQPHNPGSGRPIFAKPHFVRQRQTVIRVLCTVCGNHTPSGDRWWFGHGKFCAGMFMTTEAPVHRMCAELALANCPHLRGREADLQRFPPRWAVVRTMVGGPATEKDFGVRLGDRQIVGGLQFMWPESAVQVKRAGAA